MTPDFTDTVFAFQQAAQHHQAHRVRKHLHQHRRFFRAPLHGPKHRFRAAQGFAVWILFHYGFEYTLAITKLGVTKKRYASVHR